MKAVLSVAIFSVLLSAAFSATVVPVTKVQGCVYNGKTYAQGENFQPTPCEHCLCAPDGQVPCAIVDCFFTPCVDAIHDPKQCCPVCPNGENCRHKDGTIIKKGDTYHPDAHTSCRCPENSFMFGAPLAICTAQQAIQTVS